MLDLLMIEYVRDVMDLSVARFLRHSVFPSCNLSCPIPRKMARIHRAHRFKGHFPARTFLSVCESSSILYGFGTTPANP